MKPFRLLSYLFLSLTLISGCSDISDADKAELKSFLDGYADEDNQEISISDARDKDYLGDTDVEIGDTQGSARIGGEVALSSLEDPAQANSLNQASLASRLQARETEALTSGSFTVSFINGSGQKETLTVANYTVLIHYPSDGGDPQFIIEGLGDGINYIVEVAVTVDGEDLNLKSVAFVPPGATKSEKAVIDPISTVVAEAVQEKVTSGFFATGGDKFSQDYISDLNETLTAIIEEVIENNPEISITNFEVAITSDTGIDNLVSKLLADETVNAGLEKLEDVAVEEKFEAPTVIADADTARQYIGRLFNELFNDKDPGEGGGGAPQLFIDFFGDQFFDDQERTIQQVFDALAIGLAPQDDPDTGADESGPSPFTAQEQATALSEFKSDFAGIYAAINTLDSGSASDDSMHEAHELLSDIPQMLLAVFPPSESTQLAALTATSSFDVPQAITMIFYVLDVYLKEDDENSAGGDDEGDDFNPKSLLSLYGFDDLAESAQAAYASVDLNWLGIHPGRMWVTTNDSTGAGEELDVLNAFTCVDAFLVDSFDITGVTLTYPTANSTATIDLVDQSTYPSNHGGDDENSCWVWDTWSEQEVLIEAGSYGTHDDNSIQWNNLITQLQSDGKIISDFTSGDYVVTVSYTDSNGADSVTKTFNKKIITGLQQLNPRLTSPNSQPRYPEGNISPDEWEAYNDAQNDFTATTFPVGSIGTIQWKAPEGLANAIPEGVIAAYNLNISHRSCTGTGDSQQCDHQDIFNTWEENSQIFDTQFELPGYAKDLLVENTNVDSPYEVNIGISFLDALTGEYLGNGGHSNAQFYVGEAIELTDTFTLTGSASNVPDDDFTNTSGTTFPASSYKVALIEESCDQNSCSNSTVLVSSLTADGDDYSYTLSPTFAQAKGTSGSWLNILMFIDEDADGTFDAPTEANNFQGEPQFWSLNHVNFNTWGGVLRLGRHSCNQSGHCEYNEEAVTPDTTYDGPDFDTNPEEFNEGGTAAAGAQ